MQQSDVSPAGEVQVPEVKDIPEMLPPEVVQYLDRFIVAQGSAKRAVALALRSRWRRLQVPEPLRHEITPKNILMIGPTGVGKTEIARRLARLTKAPFVKVEASKFTEVGYIGRDVESIIRDLADASHAMIREEYREKMKEAAADAVEEQLLKLLLTQRKKNTEAATSTHSEESQGEKETLPSGLVAIATDEISKVLDAEMLQFDPSDEVRIESEQEQASPSSKESHTKDEEDELKARLLRGELEDEEIEIEVVRHVTTHVEIMGPPGFAEVEGQLKDMLSQMVPRGRDRKILKVKEAREVLLEESLDRLIDPDEIKRLAIQRTEESGIVFIDEIDKIAGGGAQSKGPDVSREGVQRDLLPLVEGSTVSTRYGHVKTDHILFIASGAFHFSKPSDLMPEFQGRFPIRVELESLTSDHFFRILNEPDNALPKQYAALLKTEDVALEFEEKGLQEIARVAAEVNERIENIGARRLQTLLEKILEDISFDAHKKKGDTVVIDKVFVEDKLSSFIKDDDITRFIL
jgi:ATP-dependent HslUV protease ATP-binding subunit HslU